MKKLPQELSDLLTPEEAARLLRVHTATLGNWRTAGRGPRFTRAGRHIRYARNDLAAYVAARTRQSTSEPAD